MNTRNSILSLAVALAFAGAASAHDVACVPAAVTPPVDTKMADPMTETNVRALLTSNGYTEINDVEFKEGSWTADARSADGNHIEVRIDSATGKIYPDTPVSTLTRDQIIIKMQAAGYTNVHDVDLEGGVWKAEANDSDGNDVEVKLDPDDGHIIGSEKDTIGASKPVK